MPRAMQYPDDMNNPAARRLEEAYEEEMRQRRALHGRNWRYYYGDHPKPMKPDATGTDDNVIVNMIELAVDKSISSLMGTAESGTLVGPTFNAVLGEETNEPDPADEYLEQLWQANDESLFFHDLALIGAVCGHLFVKILPDALPDPAGSPVMFPRFVLLNPDTVAVFWSANDISHILWYRVEFDGGDDQTYREDIIARSALPGATPDTPGWVIRRYARRTLMGGGQWTPTGPETEWPYNWPPIVDFKNLPRPLHYYGSDDLRRNSGLNDNLNFTASNVLRIIKHHAHPKTVGTGMTQSDILPSDIDTLFTVANPEAKLFNLEMQSDLSSSLSFMQYLRSAFYDSQRELDPATVQDKLGAITNFGLRVLYRDSLEKLGTKRLLFGAGLCELCQRALELVGIGVLRVTSVWPEALPSDPLPEAQALVLDRQNGLSQDTYLEKRGYDPEVEKRNREQEIAEGALQQTLSTQGALLDRFRRMTGNDGSSIGQPGQAGQNIR